jgi:tricorn protease-like protein
MESQKRKIPKVAPVSREGIRYEVVSGAKERGFGQNGGVIAAVSEAGKKEQWTLVVYRVDFDAKEEEDVQEIYITKLALSKDGKQLVVDNERHKRFVVTLSDRSVVEAPGK